MPSFTAYLPQDKFDLIKDAKSEKIQKLFEDNASLRKQVSKLKQQLKEAYTHEHEG